MAEYSIYNKSVYILKFIKKIIDFIAFHKNVSFEKFVEIELKLITREGKLMGLSDKDFIIAMEIFDERVDCVTWDFWFSNFTLFLLHVSIAVQKCFSSRCCIIPFLF